MKDMFFGSVRMALTGVAIFAITAAFPLMAQAEQVNEDRTVTISTDSSDDYEIAAGVTLTLTVPAGVTNTLSGRITGEGIVRKEGAGGLRLSGSENSYSGGTYNNEGCLFAAALGAFGTGGVTNKGPAHLCFDVQGGVFSNSLWLTGANKGDGGWQGAPVQFLKPTELTGKISGDVCIMLGNLWAGSGPENATGQRLILRGDIVTANAGMTLFAYDKTTIYGTIDNSVSGGYPNFGLNWSSGGTIELASPSNVWRYGMKNRSNVLSCLADNVVSNATIYWDYPTYGKTTQGEYLSLLKLNGHSQRIRALRSSNDSSVSKTTSNGFMITSTDPATLTILGESSDRSCRCRIQDEITLVLDAVSYPNFVQIISNRICTTTGDLLISNGTLKVESGAAFPNVPKIYVGEKGVLRYNTTEVNALLDCTNLTVNGKMSIADTATDPFAYNTVSLTLGEKAEFTLPSGYTLTVPYLKVGDGDPLPDDTYGEGGIALDQLKGGSIIVHSVRPDTAATWTGEGGADTSVGTAANWGSETVPDFDHATLLATFATGGAGADVVRDLALRGIVLSKPDTGFSFTGEGRAITLEAAGFTFSDATPADAENPRMYRIEPSVEQFGDVGLNLNIPANVTLDFAGGYLQRQPAFNVKTGDGALVFGSEGCTFGDWQFDGGVVELSGSYRIDGRISVTNTTIKFSGALTQVTGPNTANVSTYNWKPAPTDMDIYCRTNSHGVPLSRIVLDNADISKTLGAYGPSVYAGNGWFTTTANSTNIFRGQAVFPAPVGNICLGSGSAIIFEGSVGFDGQVNWTRSGEGTGTVVFRGNVSSISGSGQQPAAGTVLRFEQSGQITANLGGFSIQGGTMVCAADNIFSLSKDQKCTVAMLQIGSVIDLTDTTQEWKTFSMTADPEYKISGTANTKLTGLPGCELRLRRGYVFCKVEDAVSLTSCGTNLNEVLLVTNRACTAGGDIKAESGTFEFADNASWQNGTNVTVCSGAVLKVNASETFGEHAVLHTTGESWNLFLNDGVKQRFAEFYINGVRQPSGTYGAADNAAAKYRLANITGAGLIRVGKPGMLLSVR